MISPVLQLELFQFLNVRNYSSDSCKKIYPTISNRKENIFKTNSNRYLHLTY